MKRFIRKWGAVPFLFCILMCTQSVYSTVFIETPENLIKPETYVLLVDLSSSAISGSEKLNRDFTALKKSFILSGVDSKKIVILGQSGSYPWSAPNRHNILNMLNSFCMAPGPNDTVLIFVSGKASGHICSFKTQKVRSETEQKQTVDAKDFLAALEICAANNRFLFLNTTEKSERYIRRSSENPFGNSVDEESDLLKRDRMITVIETPPQSDITRNMIRLAHMYVAISPADESNKIMIALKSRLSGIKPNVYLLPRSPFSDSQNKVRIPSVRPNNVPIKRESPKVDIPAPPQAKKSDKPKDQKTPVATVPTRHLLSLGISKYQDSAFPQTGGESDCETVREYFVKHCNVILQNSICLSDSIVSNYGLENLICKYLPKRVKPGDPLFIYLNGHFYFGDELTNKNDFLFLPYDAKFDAKGKNLLKMSILKFWLNMHYEQSPILLILDIRQTFDLSEKEKANILSAFAGFKNLSVIIPTIGKTSSLKSKNSLLAEVLCDTLRNKNPETVQELYDGMNTEFKARLEKDYHNTTDKLFLYNSGNEDLRIVPSKTK